MLAAPIDNSENEILSLYDDEGFIILNSIDWKEIEEILLKIKNKRGRRPFYEDISKMKMIVYFRVHRIFEATRMVRKLKKENMVMRSCGLKKIPSHDIISDFLQRIEPIIEEIFKNVVNQAIRLGIIKGKRLALDPTSIKTKYKSDKDAKWSWDETKKEHYFGYGGDVLFDPETQLPVVAMFTGSKKAESGEPEKIIEKAESLMKLLDTEIFLADGEFDIIKLQEDMMNQYILPVMPYNSRNTKEPLPIKYRVQNYFDIKTEWLDEEFQYRAEAEHGWSTIKEEFGLERVICRGWKKVKSHFFLCLMTRIMYAIAVFKNCHGVSVTKTVTVL